VLAWPDTLLNLSDATISAMRVCDLVACYSRDSATIVARITGSRVEWVPFAADTELFPSEVSISTADEVAYSCDVSFVGNHRPEREKAILELLDAGISVKVWAAAWTERARDAARAKTYFQGKELVGRDVVKAMRCSKLCLNVIDRTNYPATNMRFFETYACGGTPLSSRCPEMEPEFVDGETVAYYDDDELVTKARMLLANDPLRRTIRENGRKLALAKHRYEDRVTQILTALGLA
jgi:spore maturation protein CgeB